MATAQVDLTRVSTFRVFMDYLSSLGVSTDGPIRKHGLPDMQLLVDQSAYLPMVKCERVIEDMVRREGIDDIALRIMECNGLPYYPLKPQANLLSTLREGLPLFNFVHPSRNFCLTLHGDVARVCVRSLANHSTKQLELFNWGFILQTMALIQASVAEDWKPGRIGIQGKPVISEFTREQFAGAELIPGEDCYWIEVPTRILSRPLSGLDLPKMGMENAPQIGWRLKHLMRSYLREGDLSLSMICDVTNSSRRTVQRRLALEGYDYRQMLLDVRYEVACEMLTQQELKVIEISEFLGYSDPAHFSRAFRRTGGVSPTQYRQGFITG